MFDDYGLFDMLPFLLLGIGYGRGWRFPGNKDEEELGSSGPGPNDRVTEGDVARITEGGVQREIE